MYSKGRINIFEGFFCVCDQSHQRVLVDQSDYVDKSDHVSRNISVFFFIQNIICQNEVVIITFDICPLKYDFFLRKICCTS